MCDAELSIKGYKIFRGDRLLGEGGGACIYVRNVFRAYKNSDFNYSDCVAINVTIDSIDFVLICVYRATSLSYADNCALISYIDSFLKTTPATCRAVMVGDFNLGT